MPRAYSTLRTLCIAWSVVGIIACRTANRKDQLHPVESSPVSSASSAPARSLPSPPPREVFGDCPSNAFAHAAGIASIANSPDGKWLATGSQDKTVKLWALPSGNMVRELRGHRSTIGSLTFSPDSKLLASSSEADAVRLWHVPSGELFSELVVPNDRMRSSLKVVPMALAFSPDALSLVAGAWIWDVRNKKVSAILSDHTGGVAAAAFSKDGKWLASASTDDTVKVWPAPKVGEAFTGGTVDKQSWLTKFAQLSLPVACVSIAFSPDGARLATGGKSDFAIRVWEMPSGKAVKSMIAHSGSVSELAFGPAASWLVSGSTDTTMKIWELPSGRVTTVLKGHSHPLSGMVLSPDRTRLTSASWDKTVRTWEVPSGNFAGCLTDPKLRASNSPR